MAALTLGVLLTSGVGAAFPARRAVTAALFAIGVSCVAAALAMAAGGRWGRVASRDRLLDALALRGDEQVLDVGCGRGLMLVGAASRLARGGRAIGVDTGGRRGRGARESHTALANARRAGVADRVAVHDADPRALPFADGTFDVVLSALAIHRLPNAADRAAAIGEILRVARPGGRIVIIDRARTDEYARELGASGAASTIRSGPRLWGDLPVRLILARR